MTNALNDQLAQLAEHYKISSNTRWDICYTARHGIDSCRYHEQSSALEIMIGEKYKEIEDAVLSILEKTHRCSSMVEISTAAYGLIWMNENSSAKKY